jgi:hypothetical protein
MAGGVRETGIAATALGLTDLQNPAQKIFDGRSLLRCVADAPAATDTAADRLEPALIAHFATLVTPALAGFLLGDDAVDAALMDAGAASGLAPGNAQGPVARSRLVNRFNAAAQRATLLTLLNAGFDLVVIKGFALAHTLYPAPEIRTIGDLDILLRAGERDRLIAFLAGRGFTFRPLPTPRWGFISTASYMPFVSADGSVNLDIHVHPDCYPAYRSLTTERVFAAACFADAGEGCRFRVPDDTQAFLLCATNAAKDKFGAFAVRKIIDALRLLRHGRLDLEVAEDYAVSGRFRGPFLTFCALLRVLGADLPARYDASRLPPHARGEFARLCADTLALYPSNPGLLATLRRELTLCTEPSVGLHNALVRLAGLVRPGSGVPHGAATLR